jgi:hypothetical protein
MIFCPCRPGRRHSKAVAELVRFQWSDHRYPSGFVLALRILRCGGLQHCDHRDVAVQIYALSDGGSSENDKKLGDAPSSNGMDGIDDAWRQLSSLPSLSCCSFIKNVIWLAVYPCKICIKQCVVLESGWRLLANKNSQHVFTSESSHDGCSPHKLVWEADARMTLWRSRSWLLNLLCFDWWWGKSIWRSRSFLGWLLVHCISHALCDYRFLYAFIWIFPFVFQPFFQSVHAFQQRFEHVGLGTSFLGNRIYMSKQVSLMKF